MTSTLLFRWQKEVDSGEEIRVAYNVTEKINWGYEPFYIAPDDVPPTTSVSWDMDSHEILRYRPCINLIKKVKFSPLLTFLSLSYERR